MAKVTVEFLREIQARGWDIETVEADSCVGRCPTVGCNLRATIKPGGSIPARLVKRDNKDLVVTSFVDLAGFLRDRRATLALTLGEVEDVAGVTGSIIAKAEMKTALRGKSIGTIVPWAGALGYELVLRPMNLSPMMLRTIAESRSVVPLRRRHANFTQPSGKRDRRV